MYAGGVNFTSFLFMNVYRIYISLLFVVCKKGENIFISLCLLIFFCCLTKRRKFLVYDPFVDLFWHNGGIDCFLNLCLYPFVDDWQKWGEIFVFYMHVYLFYMHVYLCFPLASNAYMSINVYWYQEHCIVYA